MDMTKLMTVAKRFHKDEDGAAMVEYSILLGIIAAASILAVLAIGAWVSGQFSNLCTTLNDKTAITCVPGSGTGGAVKTS
jgi:pilus assembly protein Flp/PilA